MARETPGLIDALKALVEKLKPAEEDDDFEISSEDAGLLREKLLKIKEACETLDSDAVGAVLNELKLKKWPNKTRAVFDGIATHLLHSDFDEAVTVCTDYLSDMENT
jgi:hypothetical protein